MYITLEKEGISSIDISLAEEHIGRNYQLTFQISSEKGILADPISIPQNLPYILTGKETIPYERIWLDLSKICSPHPLAYLGQRLTQDYTKNIPNALHLVTGWLVKRKILEFLIEEGKQQIQIYKVGEFSYDKNHLDLLEKLSLKSYPEIYQDFLTKDAQVI